MRAGCSIRVPAAGMLCGAATVPEIECIPKTEVSVLHCIPSFRGVYHVCIPAFKSVYRMCVPPSCLLCGGVGQWSRIVMELKNVTLDLHLIYAFSRHHFNLRTVLCTDLQAGSRSSVGKALLW